MGNLMCPQCNTNDLAEVKAIPNTDPPLYEYRCGNCDAVVHKYRFPSFSGEAITSTELVAEVDPPSISIHGGYVSIPIDAVPSGTTVQVTMTYTLVVHALNEAD
jgi:hypothetical protein